MIICQTRSVIKYKFLLHKSLKISHWGKKMEVYSEIGNINLSLSEYGLTGIVERCQTEIVFSDPRGLSVREWSYCNIIDVAVVNQYIGIALELIEY